MLSKYHPFIFPNFKNIQFALNNFFINQIILGSNYTFFFILKDLLVQGYWKPFKSFNKFYLKTFSIHWVRVSFKGKGYRLRKFRNFGKVTLNFGHSHWTRISLSSNFFFKKFKRQNYLCLISSFFCLQQFKFLIKFIRRLNPYTKRGLRLKKQFIRKRFGKISQVVSSLH